MEASKKHLKLAAPSQVWFLLLLLLLLSLHNASVLVHIVYQQTLGVALEWFIHTI